MLTVLQALNEYVRHDCAVGRRRRLTSSDYAWGPDFGASGHRASYGTGCVEGYARSLEDVQQSFLRNVIRSRNEAMLGE